MAWDLVSASLADLAGDGTTGDLTGITTIFFLTTATLNPIAERFSTTMRSIADEAASIIAGLISATGVRVFMVEESRVEMDFRIGVQTAATTSAGTQRRSMELERSTALRARIAERSVGLATAAKLEASLLPGARASVGDSMAEAASMVAEVMVAGATGNSAALCAEILSGDEIYDYEFET